MRLAIVTNFPSYHQVDLFNQLAQQPGIELRVFYLRHMTPGRQWTALRAIHHPHEFVPEWRLHRHFYLNPGLPRRLRRFRPALLVITQYASIAMQSAMYRRALRRKPWVYWSEAPGVLHTELPIFRSDFLRRFFRAAALFPLRLGPSQVWAIGQRAEDQYRRLTSAPCFAVPYFSDQSAFRAIERGSVVSPPLRFLYSGKLVHRKGFDTLLRAVQKLSSERTDFQVIIMGDGPERQLVAALPPEAQARIVMSGFKELQEVPAVYAQADVLVFPSRYDGWGMAAIEAMAAAMPVIASTGANSAVDAIEEGVSGFLVPPDDPAALAHRMRHLLEHPALVRAMGAAARERAQSYSAAQGAARISRIVTGLVSP